MNQEDWDAFAAKFGQEQAVQMLGPRPMGATTVGAGAPPVREAPRSGAGNTALDMLQRFSQGVTLRFGDELAGMVAAIPGGMTPREAIDASRRATDRARERTGMAGAVAEGVGTLATGALGAMLGAPMIARAPVMASGAIGALEAGGYAAGGATGGVRERARAAVVPAAVGGAIGMAAPVVANALTRRAAGRGARVAEGLREATGITDDINVTRQNVANTVRQVRTDSYGPFGAMPKVPKTEIAANLSEEVQRLLPDGDLPFESLQGIRQTLRARGDRASADMLSDAMERFFPGLRDADRTYFAAQQIARGSKEGLKAANKSGADVEWISRNLAQTQREPFRQALVQRTSEVLTMRDEQAGAMLNRLLDQGPEGARRVRQFFPDGTAGEEGYRAFQSMIAKERSAAAVGKAFKRIARPLGLMAAGAAGYGAFTR